MHSSGRIWRCSSWSGRSRPSRLLLRCSAVLMLFTLGVAACDSPTAPVRAPEARAGGTLRVSVATIPAHLDPQRVRTPTEANVSRLITRTLTTFRGDPGPAGSGVVGDLATDAGRPAENNQVWEYTLKPGVRWEDGSPVSCADVKYGVERSYSALLNVAQPYPRLYLQDNKPAYAGPYVGGNNGGKGLESVQCVDSRTVRFRLKRPVEDFSYLLAMTAFAPVPAKQDKKRSYDDRPYANGPYRVQKKDAGSIVLIRNPTWTQDTDPVRRGYPDRIVITANADAATATSAVIGGAGDWANTVLLDQDVAPAYLQQVLNDPVLGRQVMSNVVAGIRYFAINTRRVDNLDCRKALNFAFNKRRFIDALGGTLLGDRATSMLSPSVRGYRDFDLYGTKDNPNGNPDMARQLAGKSAAAGTSCSKVTVAFPDREDVRRPVSTMIEPYQAAGIKVELRAINPTGYWDTVGDPANDNDLIYAEWVPPWPSGAAVIAPLFDGGLIPESGATNNQNLSLLDNEGITKGIAGALATTSPDAQNALWGELDEKIQQRAATIPLVYPKAIRMAGSNVRGGYIHPEYGQPDLAGLGLADVPRHPSSIPPSGASYPSGAARSGTR